MMTTQPMLQEQEWAIIMELLESEKRELPMELRHTDSKEYAEALEGRRHLIEGLIERLRAQGVVS